MTKPAVLTNDFSRSWMFVLLTLGKMEMLILLLGCITWSSAVYIPEKAAAAALNLKYLLEPPVYAEVAGHRGQNVTLPCILRARPSQYRVKWSKLEPERVGPENVILVSNEQGCKPYGPLGRRASVRRAHVMDASLQLSHLQLLDEGMYRCQLVHGIEDESVVVSLWVEGVVFPYQSESGRYRFTFHEAKEACAQQDSTLASFSQLYRAWMEGLDWCNAGWLRDGTVHYPIIQPRPACGVGLLSGIRSYGAKDKQRDHYDAFCFTSQTAGFVFFVSGAFSFQQAADACRRQEAQLALVGQLYAAWRFQKYDQCDGGWLSDGSVRFPISAPRERCGGIPEAGVRSFGFPDKSKSVYGAYCYRH